MRPPAGRQRLRRRARDWSSPTRTWSRARRDRGRARRRLAVPAVVVRSTRTATSPCCRRPALDRAALPIGSRPTRRPGAVFGHPGGGPLAGRRPFRVGRARPGRRPRHLRPDAHRARGVRARGRPARRATRAPRWSTRRGGWSAWPSPSPRPAGGRLHADRRRAPRRPGRAAETGRSGRRAPAWSEPDERRALDPMKMDVGSRPRTAQWRRTKATVTRPR